MSHASDPFPPLPMNHHHEYPRMHNVIASSDIIIVVGAGWTIVSKS